MAAVADEIESGGITWCRSDVRRLITPYPARREVDRILANLGDTFYHDDVHALDDGDNDTAVAEGDQEAPHSSSDDSDGDDKPIGRVDAAVAGDGEKTFGVAGAEKSEFDSKGMEIVPLSAPQADAVHRVKSTIAALEATIESLREIGSVRGVQSIEAELKKGEEERATACQRVARSRGCLLAAPQG